MRYVSEHTCLFKTELTYEIESELPCFQEDNLMPTFDPNYIIICNAGNGSIV